MATSLFSSVRSERVNVLQADEQLGQGLSDERRRAAEPLSVARVLRRDPGTWDARHDPTEPLDGFGLLVIEGMLVRRVGYDNRFGAELLGPGDLLRPWEHDGDQAVLPFSATWRVLSDLRLAVLDRAWATRMGAFPEVTSELLGRSQRRSRRLAAMLVISQQPKLDEALWLFFWELADRYGRVRPDGTHVGLQLTHELIGYLIGARRPSVSTAVKRLERAGKVRRDGRAWVLLGDPPMPPSAD